MARTRKAPEPTGLCWCRCGEATSEGRFFRPGHDRRAFEHVLKAKYGGSLPAFLVAHGFGPRRRASPKRKKKAAARSE
jgi:hypothetical protein